MLACVAFRGMLYAASRRLSQEGDCLVKYNPETNIWSFVESINFTNSDVHSRIVLNQQMVHITPEYETDGYGSLSFEKYDSDLNV